MTAVVPLALAACDAAAPAPSPHRAELAAVPRGVEIPERIRTGALQGADRSGDLRPEARAILDAAEEPGPLTVGGARARGLAPERRARAGISAPETIRVWRRGLDGSTSSCAGRVDEIPLEQYVRGVLPHEWIRSWDPESLKAGAVAIRTYASAWAAMGGKYDCADLDDTTSSQVYEDEYFPRSDAAVEATAGIFAVKDGDLVFAEYSAENGDPTADGVSEPHCTGETVRGHGRGTCQWGTQRWASAGKTFEFIVPHYYPGAELRRISAPYDAIEADRDAPVSLAPGAEAEVTVSFKNAASEPWAPGATFLGTAGPRDRASALHAAGDWVSESRAATFSAQVAPGEIGQLSFTIRAPEVDAATTLTEEFQLVQEGVTWFGPVVSLELQVADPESTGTTGEDPGDPGGGTDERDPGGGDAGGGQGGAADGSGPVGAPSALGCRLAPGGGEPGAAAPLCAILALGGLVTRRRARRRRGGVR